MVENHDFLDLPRQPASQHLLDLGVIAVSDIGVICEDLFSGGVVVDRKTGVLGGELIFLASKGCYVAFVVRELK